MTVQRRIKRCQLAWSAVSHSKVLVTVVDRCSLVGRGVDTRDVLRGRSWILINIETIAQGITELHSWYGLISNLKSSLNAQPCAKSVAEKCHSIVISNLLSFVGENIRDSIEVWDKLIIVWYVGIIHVTHEHDATASIVKEILYQRKHPWCRKCLSEIVHNYSDIGVVAASLRSKSCIDRGIERTRWQSANILSRNSLKNNFKLSHTNRYCRR